MQKRIFDKEQNELNDKILQLENVIREKDKELRLQALKIKELVRLDQDQRKQAVGLDFNAYQQLVSPNRSHLELQEDKKIKLDAQRDLHRKYGRVNPGIKLKKVPLPVASVDNLQKVSNISIKQSDFKTIGVEPSQFKSIMTTERDYLKANRNSANNNS